MSAILEQKKVVVLGRTVVTRGIDLKMNESKPFAAFITGALVRHANGDWGPVLSAEDLQANDDALEAGDRLLSAYEDNARTKIWIITEWDRSATTILFPDEY